jgi:Fic family protein
LLDFFSRPYLFSLELDWQLISKLSQIDRYDAAWSSIERQEGDLLKQLRTIATIKSVASSTRIEGSDLSNEEVEDFLKNIDITKIENRDEQEVLGYFEALEIITESYEDISITESSIKALHNVLMKHSEKDAWHKGNYKKHSNAVEATLADGTRQIVFKTTDAGFATDNAMEDVISWYSKDNETHIFIKCAILVYEFLSIHPFQDGNGRMSRLMTTLLLLRCNYKWIQYISFEHEVESRKSEYYNVLRSCQAKRPNENIDEWINFFIDCVINIQIQLLQKLNLSGIQNALTLNENSILKFIENKASSKSSEIAKKLNIPLPTVKATLAKLTEKRMIVKNGVGKSTYYTRR